MATLEVVTIEIIWLTCICQLILKQFSEDILCIASSVSPKELAEEREGIYFTGHYKSRKCTVLYCR